MRRRKRKCRNCEGLFHPDPRNVRHQKYCSEIPCRKASKLASQHRWLSKESNENYFRGTENVQRVQAWRETHPGYYRQNGPKNDFALQDHSLPQESGNIRATEVLKVTPLQDFLNQPGLVLIGLVAQLSDLALQDDIVEMGQRLINLGGDILNNSGAPYDNQTSTLSRSNSPNSYAVQLD